MLSPVSLQSGIAMWASILLIGLFVGQVMSQSKPFPFGPRRRVLPGQRSSGCSDCAAELKQCILTCVEKFDCSEMNIKEGFCPVGDKKPENCSISSASFLNVCKTDTDCPGTKKCCHSGCSKVCASALPVPPQAAARRSRTPMKLGIRQFRKNQLTCTGRDGCKVFRNILNDMMKSNTTSNMCKLIKWYLKAHYCFCKTNRKMKLKSTSEGIKVMNILKKLKIGKI